MSLPAQADPPVLCQEAVCLDFFPESAVSVPIIGVLFVLWITCEIFLRGPLASMGAGNGTQGLRKNSQYSQLLTRLSNPRKSQEMFGNSLEVF